MSRTHKHMYQGTMKSLRRIEREYIKGLGRKVLAMVGYFQSQTWDYELANAYGVGEWYINYYSKAPKWWRKLHKHQPKRRQTRDLLSRITQPMTEDGTIWPDHKKPVEYYW